MIVTIKNVTIYTTMFRKITNIYLLVSLSIFVMIFNSSVVIGYPYEFSKNYNGNSEKVESYNEKKYNGYKITYSIEIITDTIDKYGSSFAYYFIFLVLIVIFSIIMANFFLRLKDCRLQKVDLEYEILILQDKIDNLDKKE